MVADTNAQSIFQLIAAKDIAEKLFEEARYKIISVEVIKGARQRAFPLADGSEQELEAAKEYLPKVSTLDRMIRSSQAGRRLLLKELRQPSSGHPPLAAHD